MKVKEIDSKDIVDLIRQYAFDNPDFYCLEGSFPFKGDRVRYTITNANVRTKDSKLKGLRK